MKLGNVFLAIVAGFFALFIFGCGWSVKIDSSRPRDIAAFDYYTDRLNSTSGTELEEVSLAIEWLDMTGELSEDEYNALQTIYHERKGE